MTKQRFFLISLTILALLLAGCGSITNLLANETPTAATATPTLAPTPTTATLGVNSPISLQLWVAPQFDPAGDDPAAALLSARLDEYSNRHPGVRVVTRVKAETGPAGMLETLSAAVAAAPLALPDLVLFSSQDARTAMDQGLIYPLENPIDFSADNDWFDFNQDLVSGADGTWGIPLAADVMVMVYRPNQTPEPPRDWAQYLSGSQRLMFPASDPQAEFTLLLYLSEPGTNLQDIHTGLLDRPALERVFDFYSQAEASNLMPYWLSQLDDDSKVWDSFMQNQAELGITWISQYLQSAPEHVSAARIPIEDGSTFTLASGWVLGIASPNAERRAAAEDLANFLAQADFTGSWTEAASLLPVRPSALQQWAEGPVKTLAAALLPAALAEPAQASLNLVGPPLQEAVIGLLKQELTPADAVDQVLNQVNSLPQ